MIAKLASLNFLILLVGSALYLYGSEDSEYGLMDSLLTYLSTFLVSALVSILIWGIIISIGILLGGI